MKSLGQCELALDLGVEKTQWSWWYLRPRCSHLTFSYLGIMVNIQFPQIQIMSHSQVINGLLRLESFSNMEETCVVAGGEKKVGKRKYDCWQVLYLWETHTLTHISKSGQPLNEISWGQPFLLWCLWRSSAIAFLVMSSFPSWELTAPPGGLCQWNANSRGCRPWGKILGHKLVIGVGIPWHGRPNCIRLLKLPFAVRKNSLDALSHKKSISA